MFHLAHLISPTSCLAKTLCLSFLLLITACTPPATQNPQQSAQPEKIIKLTLAHGWPKNYPIFGESANNFVERVTQMSNGRIQIRVDSANKHKSAFGIFDFVKSGQYDIGQSAAYYYAGKDPDLLYFSSMPFSMNTIEQNAWFYYGGGLQLANEVFAKHNIEAVPGGNTGVQMGGWFRQEINSVDDLKGLKMRIPGFAGKVMAGVGAVPTNIPTGELYQSLERGTIDALEWVSPGLDLRMGFHKIAPYYYTGWHEPGTELMYFFNIKKMAQLPEWAQSILRNAARLTSFTMYVHTYAANADNWATISQQYPNVQVKNFPPAVIHALKQSNQRLLEKEKQRSPLAKRIIESRQTYLKKVRAWTKIGPQAYLELVESDSIESDSSSQ